MTPEERAEARKLLLSDCTREDFQRLAELTGGTFKPGRDHMAPFEDVVTIPPAVLLELASVDDNCHCGVPIVCAICDACAVHCLIEGGPDGCWEAHERWRLGQGDPTFGPGATTTAPRRGTVGPAPKPRWPS